EEQLTTAREERAVMQRELNGIKSQAETSWASERMENAVLRERINDIAAEVAKLAITLEGPDSPIEAILAVEARTPDQSYAQGVAAASNGGVPNAANANKPVDVQPVPSIAPQAGSGTLADRMRALQRQASRALPAHCRR